MKKYAIILLLLLLIGIGLSVRLLTEDQRLDETVFLSTTESIRNLQTLESRLSLLLNNSRYNGDFDQSQLSETHYEISEEFDNLRFDALFEEIEASSSLSNAVSEFETQFATREELLEAYIESNSTIASALVAISTTTSELRNATQGSSGNSILALLGTSNAVVYQHSLDDLQSTSSESNNSLLSLRDVLNQMQFEATEALLPKVVTYKESVLKLINNDPANRQQFRQLSNLGTATLLNDIEVEYTRYHNEGIAGSNQFRNALIVYGLCLLIALAFFAWQIRKNYLSLEQEVADRTEEIKTAYEELQESQEQLIQSEKMASLGQMVAGVAHEINTPLGYVTSNLGSIELNFREMQDVVSDLEELLAQVKSPARDNAKITQKVVGTLRNFQKIEAPELMAESQQLLADGRYGLNEISTLVASLKDFARLDRQNTEQVDINTCIGNSIIIASNHIRDNGVEVITELGSLPLLACFPSKLNQLFLNVITNACQAMKTGGGLLKIRSAVENQSIVIDFVDQGIGMDEPTLQKMFDPFFTSKEVGEGTGLGMSIAYKIAQAHGGLIEADSKLNIGTRIRVVLPLEPKNEELNLDQAS